MILHVLTQSVSEYVIDDVRWTWRRGLRSDFSGHLRTSGESPVWSVATTVPERLLIITGPPVDPRMDLRQITTTPVTHWWEEQ